MFGIISGIATAVTGIVSAIGAAVSSVGGAICAGATALVAKLPEVLIAKEVIQTISTIVVKIAEALGLSSKDENVEELGAKALQEGTRPKMEDESTQEYLEYLRTQIELDKEKFDKMSENEKIACSALGSTMITKAIEEKVGIDIPSDFLLTIAKTEMKYEEALKYISEFSKSGISSMGKMTEYLSNTLKENEVNKVDSVIVTSLKELNQGISDEAIRGRIVDMKIQNNLEK